MRCNSCQKSPIIRRTIGVESDSGFGSSFVRLLGILDYAIVAAISALEFYPKINYGSFGLAITDLDCPEQRGVAHFESIITYIMITTNTIEYHLTSYSEGGNRTVDSRHVKSASADLVKCRQKAVVGDSTSWKSEVKGLCLFLAAGNSIESTFKKFRFLMTFLWTGSVDVSRQERLKALEYWNDKYRNNTLASQYQRCRKTDELGCSPAKMPRGIRYTFAA